MISARLYFWSVNGLGIAVILGSIVHLVRTPVDPTWFILAGCAVLSGVTVLRLRSLSASFSVGDVFSFAAMFLYGPEAATVTVALDALAISLRLKGTAARIVFNTAAPSLAMWCAGFAVFTLAGLPSPVRAPGIFSGALSVAVCVAVVFVLGSALVAVAIATHEGPAVIRGWRRHFAQLWANPVAGGYVGALMALSVHTFGAIALTVIIPVPLILYVAFRVTLERMDDQVRHLREWNRIHQSTIEAFATAVDAKDQVTHGHIRRVQTYCLALARELGADDAATVKALEAAALLHDVGKIGIPEHVLNKPGRLTTAEFEAMKRHVTIGADILSTVEFPFPVVPIVKAHHENWDGSGYPAGLRGEAIPLGARILSVVDCFDALTSDRPYRAALSTEEAFEVLRERRGHMYDPMIVDAFLSLQPRLAMAPEPSSPAVVAAAGTSAQAIRDGAWEPEDLAHVLVDMVGELLPGDLCIAYGVDTRSMQVVARAGAGRGASDVLGHRMPLGQGVSGWVASERCDIHGTDAILDLSGFSGFKQLNVQQCSSVFLATEPPIVLTVYGASGRNEVRSRLLKHLASAVTHLVKSISDPPRVADHLDVR